MSEQRLLGQKAERNCHSGHDFDAINARLAEARVPDDDPGFGDDGGSMNFALESKIDEQRSSSRRRIDASCQDLEAVSAECWAAIHQANESEPALFRYAGNPARLESDDRGEPVIRTMTLDRMTYFLARAADFFREKKSGEEYIEVAAAPPDKIVRDVLATPNVPLPILSRVVEAPVFAPDGALLTEPGYHAASKTFYAPAKGFVVRAIPQHPSSEDISQAKGLLLDDLLGDFPFIGESEKAHALAALLLPFARDLIDGSTPLHLFEKPTPGTGATLLVDMLALPATGRPIPTMTEGRDEDEWRKRLTAKLRSGSPMLLIDNLRRRLDSAAVSSAITSPTWEDRILGVSEICRIPVRCLWLATGNNPAVSAEISRRVIRSRVDAKVDRPWLRKDFRHPMLRDWATTHRGDLVRAALTLIQAWLAAGRPYGQQTLGMFENWAQTIGGILDFAGVPGFLGNLEDFYEKSDSEGTAWRAFILAWWSEKLDHETQVSELWLLAKDGNTLALGDGSEQSQKIRLGKMLSEMRDRIFDIETDEGRERLCLQRGEDFRRAAQWKLRSIGLNGNG